MESGFPTNRATNQRVELGREEMGAAEAAGEGDLIASMSGLLTKIARYPRLIREQWLADRARWPLWIPVALAAGAGVYFALTVEPSVATAGLVAGAGSAAGVVGVAAGRWRIALLLVAALGLGFGAAKLRTESVRAPVLPYKIGPVRFDARVMQSEPRGNGSRLVLEPVRAGPRATIMPERVRLTVRAHSDVPPPGSWVKVLAILMPPPAPSMPGDYDFGRWAYYQRIGAVGYLYGRPKPIPPVRPQTWIERGLSGLEDLRTGMTERVRAIVSGREGVIAAALITGERADIDPDDQTAFRDSGLMHVLSISGLHLALAGGLFFWIIRAGFACFPAIVLRHPIKKWAAIGALGGATFYLLISGCEAPAVRSWIIARHDVPRRTGRPAGVVDARRRGCRDPDRVGDAGERVRCRLPDVVRRGDRPDRAGGVARRASPRR
jgi:competence protein ComEC